MNGIEFKNIKNGGESPKSTSEADLRYGYFLTRKSCVEEENFITRDRKSAVLKIPRIAAITQKMNLNSTYQSQIVRFLDNVKLEHIYPLDPKRYQRKKNTQLKDKIWRSTFGVELRSDTEKIVLIIKNNIFTGKKRYLISTELYKSDKWHSIVSDYQVPRDNPLLSKILNILSSNGTVGKSISNLLLLFKDDPLNRTLVVLNKNKATKTIDFIHENRGRKSILFSIEVPKENFLQRFGLLENRKVLVLFKGSQNFSTQLRLDSKIYEKLQRLK